MKRKKPSLYDAEEQQLQEHSTHFVEFLQRKGVLEDAEISDDQIRRRRKAVQGKHIKIQKSCWLNIV